MWSLCVVNHGKIVARVTFFGLAFWKRARFPREFSSFEVVRGFRIESPVRPIRASWVRFRRSVDGVDAIGERGRPVFRGREAVGAEVEIASMLVETGPDHRICYVCRLVCNVVFTDAGWSSSVARWAHNPEVAGSNPVPATSEKVPEPEGSGTFFVSVAARCAPAGILCVPAVAEYAVAATRRGPTAARPTVRAASAVPGGSGVADSARGSGRRGSDTANPQAVRGFRPRERVRHSGARHTIPTAGKPECGQILFGNYESCAVVRTPKGILVIDHGAVA